MRFDDRLRTVLAQPTLYEHDRAVRWRQLVELVARAGGDADRGLLGQAVSAIREDSGNVPERVRSATALAVATSALPAELVAIFAADKMSVAAPILASARLTAAQWKEVAAAASPHCRAFIAAMHSEQGQPPAAATLPMPPTSAAPAVTPTPPAPAAPPDLEADLHAGSSLANMSIGDLVAKIERFRQARESDAGAARSTAELDEAPRLFRWECNESGDIDWVEGAPRGALVGQSIAHSTAGGVEGKIERAFAARVPFHEGLLKLAQGGAVGGTWKISGVPAFDRSTGRFAGYRGHAERGGQSQGMAEADPEPLRELAHEIRTPLNAIIGFAEMITGEYRGPADDHNRTRAADIAAQAQLLLTAIEDLDFAARHQSRSGSRQPPDLRDCIAAIWDEVDRYAKQRGVCATIADPQPEARCNVDPEVAKRLALRFLSAVVGCAADDENLTFRIGADDRWCTVSVARPSCISGIDISSDRGLDVTNDKLLALRIVIGLARTVQADVEIGKEDLALKLPPA